MKQRILLPVLLLIAVIGTSCVSQHNVERNYSDLRPDVVRLELTMDDYQYMGDVNIEVEYKIYLGIFSKILTVNVLRDAWTNTFTIYRKSYADY